MYSYGTKAGSIAALGFFDSWYLYGNYRYKIGGMSLGWSILGVFTIAVDMWFTR